MKLNRYAVELLRKRGYETEEQIIAFLSIKEEALRRVSDMVNGPELLEEIANAAVEKKNITVYGDYDADGVMASYILCSGLERINPGRVNVFINNRFIEGYSVSKEGMEHLFARFPETEVVITCDNGISGADAVLYAKERGIDVFVTDHHEQAVPSEKLCQVVDEKSFEQKHADAAAGRTPEEFCGAELARRVICELYKILGINEKEKPFLDSLYAYSGFATFTDIVPLRAANRYVARRGLFEINKGEGLWGVMRDVLDMKGEADADTIGFRYGPMINAASRVSGSADDALKAVFEKTPEAVNALALLNDTRKGMCVEDDAYAARLIEEQGLSDDLFLLVAGEDFREGINGLTSAHLTEKYGRPSAVLCPLKNDPSVYKGSARSVEGFDLFRCLTSHPELIKAGGHPMAAGLSIAAKDLDKVRLLLNEDVRNSGIPEKQQKEPDFEFEAGKLSAKVVREINEAIKTLSPFGSGFEPPRIRIRGTLRSVYPLRDRNGEYSHASLSLKGRTSDGLFVEVLKWNGLEKARALFPEGSGEGLFTGSLSLNEYNGNVKIQLVAEEIEAV